MTPKISSTLSLLFFLGVVLAAPSPQGAPPSTTRIPSSQLLLGKVPRCSSDSDCAHGTACVFSVGCVSRQDLTSQPGFLGDVCASSQLCSNGIRCWNAALDKEENGVCGIYGAPCDNDNHCAFGTKCVHSSGRGLCFGSPSTVPPLSSEAPYPYPSSSATYPYPSAPAPTPSHRIPSSQGYKDHVLRCSSDHDCHNGDVCVDAVGCVPHADLTSQPGHLGDICASSHDCLNGVSCWASSTQSPENGVCGVYGAPCSSNAHCTFGNTCNDLGLCSGGHFGVPSAGESYPTSPAYPATSAGSYRAGENVNIHAAAGVGDGAEDSESFLGLNFNALKSYGLAGIALLSLNALLLISLIIVVVVLKNKKPQEGSVRPHYQKRASHAAYGKLDSISEVESLRK